jgi:hypothetical protein
MREVLAGKKVMKQSLLDVPAPILPALEAALPFHRHAPTFLPAIIISGIALATSIVALVYALAQ